MRRQRAFGGTTSPTSVFLGFLDVITCGFAAALVLGIIFSIVQPYRARPAAAREHAYVQYRFTAEAAPAASASVILLPSLFYAAPDGSKGQVRLLLDESAGRRRVENLPLTVSTPGCSLDYRHLLMTAAGVGRQQYWSVLVDSIPPGWSVDVQMTYAECENLDDYVKSGTGSPPPVRLTRQGSDGSESTQELAFGATTVFPRAF